MGNLLTVTIFYIHFVYKFGSNFKGSLNLKKIENEIIIYFLMYILELFLYMLQYSACKYIHCTCTCIY